MPNTPPVRQVRVDLKDTLGIVSELIKFLSDRNVPLEVAESAMILVYHKTFTGHVPNTPEDCQRIVMEISKAITTILTKEM